MIKMESENKNEKKHLQIEAKSKLADLETK